MVENLSVVASVLILVLAVSMLIPTRQRSYAHAPASDDEKSLPLELLQLLFQFAIESWKSQNTLRNHFGTSSPGNSNSIWSSLWSKCEQFIPLSWIEPKTKLLTRQSLYSICEPHGSGEPTAWCFFAIWGGVAGGNASALTPLQQELGLREMAKQWSSLLGSYGLIAADENDCIWLAMPYISGGDAAPNAALARTLYHQLKACQVVVNDTQFGCDCRVRFTDTGDANHCEQTIKILLDPREKESPVQYYDGQQWQSIDLKAPVVQQERKQPQGARAEGSVEASPEQLTQLLAEIKTKPAAMCVKDKADDTSTAFGVQIEECIDETPLNEVELKQEAAVAEQELAQTEATVQQDLTEIRQDIDSAIAPASETEVDPSEKVTADDIAKLFAAARANA